MCAIIQAYTGLVPLSTTLHQVVGTWLFAYTNENVSRFSKVDGDEADLICGSIPLQYYPSTIQWCRCETATCSFSFGQSGLGLGWLGIRTYPEKLGLFITTDPPRIAIGPINLIRIGSTRVSHLIWGSAGLQEKNMDYDGILMFMVGDCGEGE